jgi:hypothetical protein
MKFELPPSLSRGCQFWGYSFTTISMKPTVTGPSNTARLHRACLGRGRRRRRWDQVAENKILAFNAKKGLKKSFLGFYYKVNRNSRGNFTYGNVEKRHFWSLKKGKMFLLKYQLFSEMQKLSEITPILRPFRVLSRFSALINYLNMLGEMYEI